MLDPFLNSASIQQLHHALQEGESILIEELWNSPKAFIATLAQQTTGQNILILTGAGQKESKLYHDFAFFTDRPIVDFPAWETMPSENIAPSPDIVGERYKTLSSIHNSKEPHIIISSLQACLQKLIPPNKFQNLYLTLKAGDQFSFEELIEKLKVMGYQRSAIAADKGEFAVRGGIIDIFPVSSPDPFRIDFWGDQIDSIRIYDPIGQKSIGAAGNVEITPAQEMEMLGKESKLCSIIDYLGPHTVIIFDDLLSLEDRYASLVNVTDKSNLYFSDIESFLDQAEKLQKIYFSQQPIEELSDVKIMDSKKGGYYSESANLFPMAFQMFNRNLSAMRWRNAFIPLSSYLLPEKGNEEQIAGEELLQALSQLKGKDYTVTLICASEAEQNNLQNQVLSKNITLPEKTEYIQGYLESGFALHDIRHVVLPMAEITQRYKIRRQKQRSTYHTTPAESYDLSPGEMVVHLNNGIGKYLGLEKRPNNLGVESEFFLIEYAENAKLYVPINQAHLVNKYIGASEETPKMHTLGGTRWKKTRESTEEAILGYASELLKIYAEREIKGGFAYREDSTDMMDFEEEFPYVETEDQLIAISNIKKDMTATKAMDRLVCGDVGYGKTEVAMRAAFKAVLDGGKQVAMLVPTTVLAMQHYENFCDRMRNFPVRIAVLSRFRTAKQIRNDLEGIANGTIDIVVGTHRLISKDVQFKNLGLIIIDEEQRFGVKAKEHLKKIKIGVDCLTLSATPIPRTLYMSLVGARDMSVINTPPQDRLPIRTIIAEPTDDLIKSALLRELTREGQAYIIHNRVETIFNMAERIKKLLPQARVAVVHGQMHADEIDQVFHAFKKGLVEILIATTIIENGIDIPNANTILIDRADHFGLADLYQLRGRVGRWNRRAFAYFLIPRSAYLPEITRKRLNALAESSGYGGGMKLAMRDLEIRGAGDILGTEQSGQVASIGFHLYCKLLKRTIKALQGTGPAAFTETKMEFPFDARLPDSYVNAVSLRMELYQRIGEAVSADEVDDIWEELKDRFGIPPEPVQWLYHLARIRTFASNLGYTLLKLEKASLIIEKKSKKETSTRQILIGKISSPQDLEAKVMKILNEINS